MSTQEQLDAEEMAERTIQVGQIDTEGSFALPIEQLLTGRGTILGKSGSGKSNTASVVLERLLEEGYSCMVVDVDGEYYGLKETYEVLHAGAGEACDIQVGPEHAEKLTSLALEQHVPIILDVSEYVDEGGPGEQSNEARELVRRTAQALFQKENDLQQPFLLVVEEVHEFVPEGGGLEEVGQQLVQIAKRGRKRGLGICGLSQRPADVDKDFITQADWQVWHRLTWENDRRVVRQVLGKDYEDPVADLGDGEAFVRLDWSDAGVQRVQFSRKETFDAGATPGLEDVERPELKSIDEDLVEELSEISDREERRQDEIERLQERLDEKDERIEELEQELETQETVATAARQMADALSEGAGDGEGVPEDIDEQLSAKNERISDLEAALDEREERIDDLETQLERARVNEERIQEAEEIEERFDAITAHVESLADELDVDVAVQPAVPDPEDGDGELQERVEQLEAENEDLRRRSRAAGGVTVPTDYQDFVSEDVVQEAIEEAKEKCTASPRYVKGVVAGILEEGGPVDYETIAEMLGVSTTSDVSKAASTLSSLGVVKKTQQSPAKVDFDLEGVAEIKEKQLRRQQAEAVMEEL